MQEIINLIKRKKISSLITKGIINRRKKCRKNNIDLMKKYSTQIISGMKVVNTKMLEKTMKNKEKIKNN